MSKRSLDRRAVREAVVEGRENGKTDQQIYDELAGEYHDKKTLANLITSVATEKDKDRYDIYNKILIAWLLLCSLFNTFALLSFIHDAGTKLSILLLFIFPLMNLLFIYELIRRSGYIYRLCGLFAIVGFLRTVQYGEDVSYIAFNFALTALTCAFCFYIDAKMFPNYHPYNIKKDSKGDYILD